MTASIHEPVHRRFEQVASRRPDAMALASSFGNWTYGELNARANRLARYLQHLGLTPGSRVAVCLDRSPEQIAVVLGVLKAGCAYVPVDASYPTERIAFLLRDTAASMLLTGPALASTLVTGTATQIVRPDRQGDEIARQSGSNLDLPAEAEDPAYVMYTSGSTGTPKGAVIPHRAIARLVVGATYARFAEDEVFLQLAPVSFDASTFEIWGALLNGAQLALAPPKTPSLEMIGSTIARYGVTTMWLTSGLFNVVVEQRIESLRGLRQLLIGGDVLSRTHIQRAAAALPECILINGYGPTETTTFACCHTITAADLEGGSIPIGRPIACTEVHILDSRFQPVPMGQEGEIFIGGDGVSLGYLNQPELTAQKFIAHRLAKTEGRLYRTGDLGRRRADGIIEFLGRVDDQVKIAGHRIEPGEIESILVTLPGVRQAAVVAHATNHGEKRLTAYVVVKGTVSAADLRSEMEHRLPAFMVPASIQFMDSLPLSSNGKVDRSQLPAPAVKNGPAPRPGRQLNQPEAIILEIWARVLRIAQPGLDENFFDLGGDSLGLIEVHAELERALGRSIVVTALFEFPTVRTLANHIADGTKHDTALQAAAARASKQRDAMRLGRAGKPGLVV